MQAQAAAKNLAYYKINYIMPIYLEFAPDVVASQLAAGAQDRQEETKDVEEQEGQSRSKTVFIKNLNFTTKEEEVEAIFRNANLKGKVLSVKIVRRSDNQQSKGYGFVEMETAEAATHAIKKLQNFMIDDHSLKLSLAQKGQSLDEFEADKKKSKLLKKRAAETELAQIENEEAQSNKLMVKNLAFEATADDVKELFKQFASIKKVRLPKKVGSKNHRGFGFVEFTSSEEAASAFKQLQNSHLYGRKLVIEWSQKDSL